MSRFGRALRGVQSIALVGLGLLAAAPMAQVGERDMDALVGRMSTDEAARVADLLGMCGGVYAAFSKFVEPQTPERALEYRELSNGALTAGAYLLYREHRRRTGEARPVREFMPRVAGRAEASAAQAFAAFAAEDFDAAQEMLADCVKMEEMRTFLVDAMSAEMARPK